MVHRLLLVALVLAAVPVIIIVRACSLVALTDGVGITCNDVISYLAQGGTTVTLQQIQAWNPGMCATGSTVLANQTQLCVQQ